MIEKENIGDDTAKHTEENPSYTDFNLEVEPRSPAAYEDDRQFYRYVVFALGLMGVLGVLGAILLPLFGHEEIPDVFIAAVSGVIGALGGLFSNAKK